MGRQLDGDWRYWIHARGRKNAVRLSCCNGHSHDGQPEDWESGRFVSGGAGGFAILRLHGYDELWMRSRGVGVRGLRSRSSASGGEGDADAVGHGRQSSWAWRMRVGCSPCSRPARRGGSGDCELTERREGRIELNSGAPLLLEVEADPPTRRSSLGHRCRAQRPSPLAADFALHPPAPSTLDPSTPLPHHPQAQIPPLNLASRAFNSIPLT